MIAGVDGVVATYHHAIDHGQVQHRPITVHDLRAELMIAHARRLVYESVDRFSTSLEVIATYLRPLDYLNSPIGECFLCR